MKPKKEPELRPWVEPAPTPPPAPPRPFTGCLACWADSPRTSYYHTCGKENR